MRKERKLSEATRAKMSAAHVGKKFTAQHKQHLRAALQKYWAAIPYTDGTTHANNF